MIGPTNAGEGVDSTLYDRLGGDAFMDDLIWTYFDEIVEHSDLKSFFKNVPLVAMRVHFRKFFKVVFGTKDEKPNEDDLFGHLLKAHTRLFRELGLDETHFDIIVVCLLECLGTFQVSQALIDECEALIRPLRIVFEYGAQLAREEKERGSEQLAAMPPATMATFQTQEPASLPVVPSCVIPAWLPKALGRYATANTVRKLTCELSNQFAANDAAIADTFLDQPYLHHHPYLLALLQLAFLPEESGAVETKRLLDVLIYPRGPDHSRLSRRLFDRMIDQFVLACAKLGMPGYQSRAAQQKLRSHRSSFSRKTVKVGGATTPHALSKTTKKARGSKSGLGKSNKHEKRGRHCDQLGNSSVTSISSFTSSEFCIDSESASSAEVLLNTFGPAMAVEAKENISHPSHSLLQRIFGKPRKAERRQSVPPAC